jgi:hypothetical protein
MNEEAKEFALTDDNFSQYFFDCRQHKPQRGQIMACYSAAADLVGGPEKINLVELLLNTQKVEAAVQVMRKLFHAHPKDAIRVCRRIVQDAAAGMTVDEIVAKPYKYTLQAFFYTLPEYVPKNDPHWSSVSLLHVDGNITVEKAEK